MSYTALLTDTCDVVRRTAGTFNTTTGNYDAPAVTTLYSGACRVDSLSGAARIQVGEEAVIQSGYWVFLPVAATGPQPEDIVIIISSEDGNMVGRELVVKTNDAAHSPNSANAMRALLCEAFSEGA